MEDIAETNLKWLGVDLDGTLANNSPHPDYELLEPIEGAKDALYLLASKGWKIIIYTARPWHEYDQIENWLNNYNIPFRRIVCGKLFVKYMIDDRAISFKGDWDEVINQVRS